MPKLYFLFLKECFLVICSDLKSGWEEAAPGFGLDVELQQAAGGDGVVQDEEGEAVGEGKELVRRAGDSALSCRTPSVR